MSTICKTGDGYSRDLALDCEIALVLFLQACGSLAPTVRLGGGLVTRDLAPEAPPDLRACWNDRLERRIECFAAGLQGGTRAAAPTARRFCYYASHEGWRKDGLSNFTTFHKIGEPGDDDFVRS